MTAYQERSGDNTARNLIIAVVVVVLLCCCCLIAVYACMLLMAPVVGNVFSDVIQELEVTPLP